MVLQEEEGVHHQAEEVEVGVQHLVGEVEVGVQHQVGEEEVVDLLRKQGEVGEEVAAQHHHLLGEVEAVEEVVEEERQPPLDHREVEVEGEVVEGQEGWMVGK